MTTTDRIARARYRALTTPSLLFYGTLACELTDVLDSSIDTACTDGKRIKWNPTFVDGLTDAEVLFVLIHEVQHCAHGHLWRLPADETANVAADYVINQTLVDLPGLEMPKGGLLDRKYAGLAEEEVYKRLRDECKGQQGQQPQQPGQPQPGDGQQGQQRQQGPDAQQARQPANGKPQDGKPDANGKPQDGDGQPGKGEATPGGSKPGKSNGTAGKRPADKGGCGGFEAPADEAKPGDAAKPGETGDFVVSDAGTLRDHWDRAVAQAAQIAKTLNRGDLPADARRTLDRVTARARPDWRAETAAFVRDQLSERPDWSRQARRHALAPVLYPQRRRDDVGTVVFVRDTSGSVTSQLVSQFNAHVANILADTGCNAVILDADARVQAEYRVGPGDELPDRAEGGGGTDFRPAFARVADLALTGERIAGVVYLTDMCGRFPAPQDVDVPALWVATTDITGPFGSTVRIDEA